MQSRFRAMTIWAACCVVLAGQPGRAAREAVGERDVEGGGYAAVKMLERGEELIEMGESDRGIKMLETVIEQNPKDDIRYKAYLSLGKHYLATRETTKAIENLRNAAGIKGPREELKDRELDLYLESLYLTGVAHFDARQYSAAFSALRKITDNHPNTVWANQAYYYIGMAHFAQGRWSKAIDNLTLVGTFLDPESPEVEYVEAGHRFYVKVDDRDLPILQRLGRPITVQARAASGDRETMTCAPMPGDPHIYVGSVPTEAGKGSAGDGVLNVVGGDTIEAVYVDDSTKDGQKDVKRLKTVKVVSSGGIAFTRGTFRIGTDSAFLSQPVFIRLEDLDLDTSDNPDKVTVRLAATYEKEDVEIEDVATGAVNMEAILEEEQAAEDKTAVRDELTLTLVENAPHSGYFTGSTTIRGAVSDEEINTQDDVLSCRVGDTLTVSYVDELSIKGPAPETIAAAATVYDEIDARPRADQDVVAEPLIRAKKELVEAEALLEIARIFQSMGLKKGAREKSDQGLEKVQFAIETRAALPTELREKAFSIKWNLYLAQDDFTKAMATCRAFSNLFPESPLVDEALMGMGRAYFEKKQYEEAIKVFNGVAQLRNARSGAEALFLAAQARERMNPDPEKALAGAVGAYRSCASRFPDSEYAGPALAKVVDYHIETQAYAEAERVLSQVFLDYQDEDFLDRMLMKWATVANAMGDRAKAMDKAGRLLAEYPGSMYAEEAQDLLTQLEEEAAVTGEG